jgi:hypothetical protein
VSITKVVVLFTTIPTKFSLQFSEFSTNFYAFYKIQAKVKHYLRTIFHRVPGSFCRFTTIPLLHTKHPGINPDLAMWLSGVKGLMGRGGPVRVRFRDKIESLLRVQVILSI